MHMPARSAASLANSLHGAVQLHCITLLRSHMFKHSTAGSNSLAAAVSNDRTKPASEVTLLLRKIRRVQLWSATLSPHPIRT
jgi:hypothetical protein